MILFVCTGNTCRSPMAEAIFRHRFDEVGVDIEVTSAGTLGWNERPPTDHALAVLEQRGISLDGHRSRKLDEALVERAELAIAMTRNHAWAVAAHDERARQRTFLLGEVPRLGAQVGQRIVQESLGSWVGRLAAARGGHMIAGRVQDEVADPAGEKLEVYERVADRLTGAAHAVARLLTPAPHLQS